MNRSSEIDEITRSGVYKIHGVGATERRIHGFLFSFKAHIVFMMFSFLCFVLLWWTTRFQGGGFSNSEWVIHGVKRGYGNEMAMR
jgi:hypothetical protein